MGLRVVASLCPAGAVLADQALAPKTVAVDQPASKALTLTSQRGPPTELCKLAALSVTVAQDVIAEASLDLILPSPRVPRWRPDR